MITVASHTGSIVNLNYAWYGNQGNGYWYDVFDRTPALAIQPGSIITKDASTYSYEIRSPKLGYISISSHTGSLINITNDYISTKDSHITIASNTSSIVTISENIITTNDGIIGVVSHTDSIVNYTYEFINDKNLEYDTTFGSKNIPKDGIIFFDLDKINGYQGIIELSSATSSKPTITETVDIPPTIVVMVANATGSNPTIQQYLIVPEKGTIHYKGDDELVDRLNEDFKEISTDWGTTLDDLHFINTTNGSEGKDGYYNTYHYEKRYIFNLIGDVEHMSGSYSGSKSFDTDYTGTGTFVAGDYTASRDVKNKTFVTNEIGLGTRTLGTTSEFRYSNEFYKGGKYLDENIIYPPNHTFLVGTTKNQISDLIYKGTQNSGGDKLESEVFIDLFDDAIYEIWQTGAQGYYTEG